MRGRIEGTQYLVVGFAFLLVQVQKKMGSDCGGGWVGLGVACWMSQAGFVVVKQVAYLCQNENILVFRLRNLVPGIW